MLYTCYEKVEKKNVINKANEFYFKENRNKQFPNHPDWLFD